MPCGVLYLKRQSVFRLGKDYLMNFYENEPMSLHTTFRTGGLAKRFYEISSIEDIKKITYDTGKSGDKILVIGNGSNLLVSDKGIDQPVMHIKNNFADIIRTDECEIYAEAGATLSSLALYAKNSGLSGLEFASGIPGTVGGGITMNAGAYGGEMSDVILYADVLKNGSLQRITKEELHLQYRHSIVMEENIIIIGIAVKLEHGNTIEISDKMNEFNMKRREKQPLEYPSAGSTFKRPDGYFAGKLIMDAGLAGTSIGGAMVSPKHCGFIINYDNASSTDIYMLIQYVTEKVKSEFNVKLEPEVRLLGDFS